MGCKRFDINKYEPWEDEKRLEELSAKGEFIKSYGCGLAYFKKGEPKRIKYSIEAAVFRPHGRRRRFYEENGWKLVCHGSDMNIYANEQPDAEHIHTDRSEYAHVIQRFHKYLRNVIIILSVIAFLMYAEMPFALGLLTHTKVMFYANYGNYFPPFGYSSVILIFWIIYTITLLYYLKELIVAGRFIAENIENGKYAEKALSLNKKMTAFIALLTLFGLLSFALNLRMELISREYPAEISDLPDEAVTIEEFFPEGSLAPLSTEEDIEKYLAPSNIKKTAKPMEDSAARYTSAVTEEYFEYSQYRAYIPQGQTQGSRASIHCLYIKFHTELAAKLAVDDILNFRKEFFIEPDYSVTSRFNPAGTEFDSITAISSEKDSEVVFAVRKGRTVMSFNVYLSPDKLTAEEIFKNFPIFEKNS